MQLMFEIDESVSMIDFLLGELINRIDQTSPSELDIDYVISEISIIRMEILELNGHIRKFSSKFGYREGDYPYYSRSMSYLFECYNTLNEGLGLDLYSKPLNEKVFHELSDTVAYASVLWNEKFREEFECWSYELMSDGLYISDSACVFSEDSGEDAFLQMMQSALKAEALYFSLTRNKQYAALIPLKNDLIFNRCTAGPSRIIDAQQMSGRRLISLQIASVAECMERVSRDKLTSPEEISRALDWHKTKQRNWNRETVLRGYLGTEPPTIPLAIKYQFNPSPGQLANIRTDGVGRYGLGISKKGIRNILTIFLELTENNPEKEQTLAKLLLQYKRGEGSALGENALIQAGIVLPNDVQKRRTLIRQFNKAAYLICFQEIYRRKNQGVQQEGNELKNVIELPFGLAVSCLLMLISDGHLRFAEVLDANSQYGVFTGTKVMSRDLGNTIKKFSVLFSFFVKKYATGEYALFEWAGKNEEMYVALTPQYFHKILKQTDGGKNDSDNEEDYEPVLDKTENMQELEEKMADLEISLPRCTI